MMTMLLIYLPGAAIRERIFGTGSDGRRLTLRFNPQADRQARAAALAKAVDFDGRVDPVAVPAGPPSVRVVADGQETTGPAAAATLFGSLGWLRSVRWVLAVPVLGGVVSRWFSGEAKANGNVPAGKPQVPAAS